MLYSVRPDWFLVYIYLLFFLDVSLWFSLSLCCFFRTGASCEPLMDCSFILHFDDICWYREEAHEYIEIGTINGLFVLGRCTGFIGTCGIEFQTRFLSPFFSAFVNSSFFFLFPLFVWHNRPLSGSKAIEARTISSSLGRHFVYPAGKILWIGAPL